jgi:hypothetical protein
MRRFFFDHIIVSKIYRMRILIFCFVFIELWLHLLEVLGGLVQLDLGIGSGF